MEEDSLVDQMKCGCRSSIHALSRGVHQKYLGKVSDERIQFSPLLPSTSNRSRCIKVRESGLTNCNFKRQKIDMVINFIMFNICRCVYQ